MNFRKFGNPMDGEFEPTVGRRMKHINRRQLTVAAFLMLPWLAGCGNKPVNKAGELLRVGATKEAREVLTEEIKNSPMNAEAHLMMAKVHEADRSIDEMFKSLDSACKAKSSYIHKVGVFLWEQVKSSKCLDGSRYIRKALELDPSLAKDDEVAFSRYVTYADGDWEWEEYVNTFPKGKHIGETLLMMAEKAYERYDMGSSKTLYFRAAKESQDSVSCLAAKAKLGDWWDQFTRKTWASENQVKIAEVYKGQQIEVTVAAAGGPCFAASTISKAIPRNHGHGLDFSNLKLSSGWWEIPTEGVNFTANSDGYLWFEVTNRKEQIFPGMFGPGKNDEWAEFRIRIGRGDLVSQVNADNEEAEPGSPNKMTSKQKSGAAKRLETTKAYQCNCLSCGYSERIRV